MTYLSLRRGLDLYIAPLDLELVAVLVDRVATLSVGRGSRARRGATLNLDFRPRARRGSLGLPREADLGLATVGFYFGRDD